MKNRIKDVKEAVQERYSKIAESSGAESCCGPSCCGGGGDTAEQLASVRLGYTEEELASLPEGADLGLGCGNPQAIAAIKPGETVLDLGSGAGIDCFLAASQVGETGKVIGVDMTPSMIAKARNNATVAEASIVEFRLGEIEHLPVADDSVDVIISNCVINLSPEKEQVFQEAFRVLKPGGRLAISDVVASTEIPESIQVDLDLLSACISGAATVDTLEQMLAQTGFDNIQIQPKDESKKFIRDWAPGSKIEDLVISATIEAVKS